ncbi:MAG: hypothetical protein JWP97_6110 [Labilithrix sp.]|nr:hypothetical protein [Labilithrix sp.]
MKRSSASFVALALALAGTAAAGCAPRPRMCLATSECAGPASCVAGRCQPDRPNVRPAVDAARRLVVRPVDLAYVRRGAGASGGALPPSFVLGGGASALLLRFAVTLPADANVVEAYLVLHRDLDVDDDPTPISLHATRIVQGWDSRSTSFGQLPRQVEGRAPATRVEPGGPALVRLDVREIVRDWTKHDPADHGIAVVAESVAGASGHAGTTFALRTSGAPAPDVEPFLELYVR